MGSISRRAALTPLPHDPVDTLRIESTWRVSKARAPAGGAARAAQGQGQGEGDGEWTAVEVAGEVECTRRLWGVQGLIERMLLEQALASHRAFLALAAARVRDHAARGPLLPAAATGPGKAGQGAGSIEALACSYRLARRRGRPQGAHVFGTEPIALLLADADAESARGEPLLLRLCGARTVSPAAVSLLLAAEPGAAQATDPQGRTALHLLAASRPTPEALPAMRVALAAGAAVNAADHQVRPGPGAAAAG